MKPWGNLGVVETIYEDEVYDDEEEEDDDNSSNSPSLLSSTPSPLHSSAQAWYFIYLLKLFFLSLSLLFLFKKFITFS